MLTLYSACSDDRKPLSDVAETFAELKTKVSSLPHHMFSPAEIAVIEKLVSDRLDFIWSDAHALSNYLDPRYRGRQLFLLDADGEKDWSMKDAAEQYIKDYHPRIAAGNELVKYRAFMNRQSDRDSHWADDIGKGTTVHQWWESIDAEEFPGIRKLALRLFSLCASSSASERNFSTFSFIHNKLRNRLKEDTVEKLVHVFANCKELKSCGYTARDGDLEARADFADELTVELE